MLIEVNATRNYSTVRVRKRKAWKATPDIGCEGGRPEKEKDQSIKDWSFGSPCWTRTNDLRINSSLLAAFLEEITRFSLVFSRCRAAFTTSPPFAKSQNFKHHGQITDNLWV